MSTHYIGSEKERVALDTFIKLNRALQGLSDRTFAKAPLPASLSPVRFGILETLYHLGPLHQNELREKLLKSKGTVSISVEQLERAGLVSRSEGNEDRRFRKVAITEEGTGLISAYFPQYTAALTKEMESLTIEEQRLLGNLAKKLGKKEEQK
ncbi:MarR family winged helix-turn-helix transcriptional regulator [Sediminispirochaeta bajacaliforniensis]|uniref:MarR family winged helix-turn-helix transcriptional regulator n=1 Tax=Sediminispirochaeta bajacaliforniensis TaxID=148 RepID=UPI00037A9D43|nr:MarR family winged helix-turn-helix transcriptional regulator [Sediminispirochaeta bajacaliforniensis]